MRLETVYWVEPMTTPSGTVKMSRIPSSITQFAVRLRVGLPAQMSAASPAPASEVFDASAFLVCLRTQVAVPDLPSAASGAASCLRSVPHACATAGSGVGLSGSAAVAEAAGTNTDNSPKATLAIPASI
ncbi:hypothetical protein [Nonomuraea wenchangensis]|uniref:hypothetical protein n=1 Tax=Nonomuraea wenchangensis TaxID=568860 RepID=UPI0033232709